MKKQIITIVLVAAVIGGIGFYGGMKYYQNQAASALATRFGGRTGGAGGARGGQGGSNMVAGNIISSDASSITVGLRTGGSQIVFFSPNIPITITTVASGTPADLTSGKQVSVSGTATGGNINATSIRIENSPIPTSAR